MRASHLLIALCLVFLSCVSVTRAHESTENGSVKLLVHVDPDDVAIAGKPTTIHIAIHDAEKSFSLSRCHCSLYVEQDEKRLYTIALTPATTPSVYDAEGVEVTFPNAGDYTVGVEGTPLPGISFAPFGIEVAEHVLPAGTDPNMIASSTASGHTPEKIEPTYLVFKLSLAGLFLLIAGYLFVRRNSSRK